MKPSGQLKIPTSLTIRGASKIQNQLEINLLISLHDTTNAPSDYQPGKNNNNNKQNNQLKKKLEKRE